MAGSRLPCALLLAGALLGQGPFFPLERVRAGMKGVGKTVFAGDRIEEFGVEILGVLENAGPKQSLVLARLSGGPLEKTGILQGMSGSPVYLEGRLLGAVAMAFAFAKEPVAAIRPIQDLVAVGGPDEPAPRRARIGLLDQQLTAAFAPRQEWPAGADRLVDIATPLVFGGFTRGAIERFAPQLRALGLEPLQAVSAGGRPPARYGNPADLKPGSMISVQLVSGDMSIGADGTLTYIEGDRVYAFGHRFLAIGRTELPFARAEVLTVVPTLSASLKISVPREWMGAITEDRSTGVAGQLGRRTDLVPVAIEVIRRGRRETPLSRASYRLEMVRDRLLTPLLLQMAVFSAIDATEQALGSASLLVRGQFEFRDGSGPLRLDNMFAGDMNLPLQVSAAAAVPLAYVLQSGFDALQLKNASLQIECFPEKRQLQIEQVWCSRRQLRPGESLELTVVFSGDNGLELTRKAVYQAPPGALPGLLQFTVSDGSSANLAEYQQLVGQTPKSPAQLIRFVNSLRPNTRAYVRVTRAEPAFEVLGQLLPSPPASLALVLGRREAALGSGLAAQSSKLAELVLEVGGRVVTGSKTIQVELKE